MGRLCRMQRCPVAPTLVTNTAVSLYHQWMLAPVRVGDIAVTVATKPGVLAHGTTDPSAFMLAEWVALHAAPTPGMRALHLNSGNGLVAAVAAHVGYAPIAIDRHMANANASRRSLVATNAEAQEPEVYHAALATPLVAPHSCQLVTIRNPTDKLSVQHAIADAFEVLEVGGVCVLAGANDEGAKPAARMLADVFGHARVDAQHSSARLLVATKRGTQPENDTFLRSPWRLVTHMQEREVTLGGAPMVLCTRPGVFSWEHVDEATTLLAGAMRIADGDAVLDLGCGAGALGMVAAHAAPQGRVLLLDADADAVACATRTAERSGATTTEVRASDVTEAAGTALFDVIVSNPPFHMGKGTELAIPRAFIEQSYERLKPGGRLYLVANRTLPYEWLIAERFGEVRTAHDGRRFKVIGAVKQR